MELFLRCILLLALFDGLYCFLEFRENLQKQHHHHHHHQRVRENWVTNGPLTNTHTSIYVPPHRQISYIPGYPPQQPYIQPVPQHQYPFIPQHPQQPPYQQRYPQHLQFHSQYTPIPQNLQQHNYRPQYPQLPPYQYPLFPQHPYQPQYFNLPQHSQLYINVQEHKNPLQQSQRDLVRQKSPQNYFYPSSYAQQHQYNLPQHPIQSFYPPGRQEYTTMKPASKSDYSTPSPSYQIDWRGTHL